MKQQLQTLLFVIAFLSLLSACGGSAETSPPSIPPVVIEETLLKSLTNYINTNVSADEAGIAVLLIKNDEVVYKEGKGLANMAQNLSITPDTGFRLGSVSKVFTAIAIMKLYEQGMLSLDDSILTYLPELSTSWQDINIHHLLSHQSGIPSFINDYSIDFWPNGATNQDIVEYFIANDALEFIPGSRGEYSNTGFLLLAEIISRVSGISFADYLDLEIFQVLGMTNSYIADEFSQQRDGDALNFASLTNYYNQDIYTVGAMGQVSSLNDMQMFTTGMLNHLIITSETFDLLVQAHTPELFYDQSHNQPFTAYGYGAMVEVNNSRVFGHSGGFDGFRTDLLIRMDFDWQLVVLTNGGDKTGEYIEGIKSIVAAFNQE